MSSGTVQLGTSATIPCTFNTNLSGEYVSPALVEISDCEPNVSNDGIPAKLNGRGPVPGLKTDDYEKILSGQHLCLRYDIERLDITAFLGYEQVLHFAPPVLQHTSNVDIALVNPFPIPCSIDLGIKQRVKQPNFPFSLGKEPGY